MVPSLRAGADRPTPAFQDNGAFQFAAVQGFQTQTFTFWSPALPGLGQPWTPTGAIPPGTIIPPGLPGPWSPTGRPAGPWTPVEEP